MKDQEFSQFFREIQVRFSGIYSNILTRSDLTLPQYVLLSQLVYTGTIPMTVASKKLNLTKPAITNLVDRLEEKKLIKRLAYPKDRRVYLLEAQVKGAVLVRKIQTEVLKILLRTLNKFNAKEQKVITKFYQLLSQNINQYLSEK